MPYGHSSTPPAHGGGGMQDLRSARYRPRVLIVDDDADDRRMYGMVLCYNGFDVAFAPDIQHGVELAREYTPDVVLLDLGLPDGNGLEFCSRIQRSPRNAGLPIVVLSGFRQTELGDAARRHGCSDYLEKPVSPVEVMHRIEELVGKAPLAGDGEPPAILNEDDYLC